MWHINKILFQTLTVNYAGILRMHEILPCLIPPPEWKLGFFNISSIKGFNLWIADMNFILYELNILGHLKQNLMLTYIKEITFRGCNSLAGANFCLLLIRIINSE